MFGNCPVPTTFRPYQPGQPMLVPPDLREWVPPGHLAHHVSDVVDALDLTAFYAPYEGDDRRNASYEPSIMVKELMDAYLTGTFSSRAVARNRVEPAAALADAGYCNEPDLLELENRGIDAHVALGREGKSRVAIDTARLPATHRMGENLASLAGKARYAQRQWLSEAPNGWIKEVLGFRRFNLRCLAKVHGEWTLVCLALNINRMGVLACQRIGSGARTAHRPRMKHESLALRPFGLEFPAQSCTGHISTLGPRIHLSNERAPIAHHQDFYGARSYLSFIPPPAPLL